MSSQLSTSFSSFDSLDSFVPPSQYQKKVRFGRLDIIDMPIEIGDTLPSEGAPITIGWEPCGRIKINVDRYEEVRDLPRRQHELRLSSEERREMLLRLGYSQSQVRDATVKARGARKKREASIRNFEWDKAAYAIKRSFSKIVPKAA